LTASPQQWSHALRVSLGSFKVGSHRLQAQIDHHIDNGERICKLCTLKEIENKIHFIFQCPLYYEIRGRFYCLFRDCSSLSDFFSYYDQRCLALYFQEVTLLRDSNLQSLLPHRHSSIQLITSSSTRSCDHSKSVKPQTQSSTRSSKQTRGFAHPQSSPPVANFFLTRKES